MPKETLRLYHCLAAAFQPGVVDAVAVGARAHDWATIAGPPSRGRGFPPSTGRHSIGGRRARSEEPLEGGRPGESRLTLWRHAPYASAEGLAFDPGRAYVWSMAGSVRRIGVEERRARLGRRHHLAPSARADGAVEAARD